MTNHDFSDYLNSIRPACEAWGKCVVAEISRRLEAELDKKRFETLFKVPPGYRAKEKRSALEKVARKGYTEPERQMTDLVGARFVVLLRSDLTLVETALLNSSIWTATRDRSPEREVADLPHAFTYQSTHYIVRNVAEFVVDDVIVPADLPCEIQIRTLLQHAYAELGHDRIYKGDLVVPIAVHRLMARSMALMETTDKMFCDAVDELARVNQTREQWCEMLDSLYSQIRPVAIPTDVDDDAELVLDTYRALLLKADISHIAALFSAHVAPKLAPGVPESSLFSKPVVTALYWLLSNHEVDALSLWPLPKFRDDVERVCSDLGIAS